MNIWLNRKSKINIEVAIYHSKNMPNTNLKSGLTHSGSQLSEEKD